MPKTQKSAPKAVKKETKPLTADEIVGGKTAVIKAPRERKFNGVVDDRMIPDAGVPTEFMKGVLDLMEEGHGFLRPKFSPSDRDVYISASQIRRLPYALAIWLAAKFERPKKMSVITGF